MPQAVRLSSLKKLMHSCLSTLLTITFDTASDCVFLYSLFPASFLYT